MEIKIITDPLKLDISGFSGIAANKNYVGTAFALMDKIWPVIRAKGIKNKGLNIWVYEPDEAVFAGIELEDPAIEDTGFERKIISLPKYAYYKHIGPHGGVKQAGDNMRNEIRKMGFKPALPYIEIYGHWTSDESKFETELIMSVD
ncbi:GyrI-like domain-containing protein [Mucilaginibacter sp. UR6-11]|uniref:GyrI-like domain-containing protein n=1 Tax=Mucilaginibacter sp. UR6-11 TaxID=1435644 RepID=UPI001E53CC7B|nr:GyrI-like domain-containing protein [Mucilaginibacter sp. UR6-11]MCC8424355.1 GyrI-like domain-containing protein [Mucilaginibacter sp. UR6-11]